MMDWLGKMLNLPEEFLFSSNGHGGGVIQGTASEATLVCLLAARSRALAENKGASFDKLVAYGSAQAHSSVERAGLLGAVKFRALEPDTRLSLRGSTLEKAIEEDRAKGLIPFYCVATLGTTNSLAFDELQELGQVCKPFLCDRKIHVSELFRNQVKEKNFGFMWMLLTLDLPLYVRNSAIFSMEWR